MQEEPNYRQIADAYAEAAATLAVAGVHGEAARLYRVAADHFDATQQGARARKCRQWARESEQAHRERLAAEWSVK